jgi:DNA-binding FadR family transcriptional regulator
VREDLLHDWPGDDVLIGPEVQLLARYRVSRPTLRQAIRILEMEGLVTVKRGRLGGVYTNLPTSESASRAASTYLRSRHITPLQLSSGSIGVTRMIGSHAARNPSVSLRRQFLKFVEEHQARPPDEAEWMSDFEGEWSTRISELVDNPVLSLLWLITAEVWTGDRMAPRFDSRRDAAMRRLRHEIATAIAEGDAETSSDAFGRLVTMVERWVKADAARGGR